MLRLLVLLVGCVACSSPHSHSPRASRPVSNDWEGGVSPPERMEEFGPVTPAKPFTCEVYFQSPNPRDWEGELIDCMLKWGPNDARCACMESYLDHDSWEN